MTVMTVTKIIAVMIFVISFVTIYHNTNSYEPNKRIIYIIIGTIAMYVVTSILCNINIAGIEVKSEGALNDTVLIMKLIFTPINSMIALSVLGNIFGKVKDKIVDKDKASKYLVIFLVIFVLILVFETNYIGSFIHNLLS